MKDDMELYVELFERPLLAQTKEFFAAESALFIANHSIAVYLKMVCATSREHQFCGISLP
jgi:hypothetical protein